MDQTDRQGGGNSRIPLPDSDREAMMVQEFLKGMPKVNIAALLMPPLWGPTKGLWITILWYPLWVFADNCIFAWWCLQTPFTAIISIITVALLLAVTYGFARFSTVYAAVKAIRQGKTKEQFQRTERIWAIASVVLAIAVLAFATYYNLNIRPPFML